MSINKASFFNIQHCSFHNGLLYCNAIELSRVLGIAPLLINNDKVTFEWRLILDNGDELIPFTIYDYNIDDLDGCDDIYFHIGTLTRVETDKILNYFAINTNILTKKLNFYEH